MQTAQPFHEWSLQIPRWREHRAENQEGQEAIGTERISTQGKVNLMRCRKMSPFRCRHNGARLCEVHEMVTERDILAKQKEPTSLYEPHEMVRDAKVLPTG